MRFSPALIAYTLVALLGAIAQAPQAANAAPLSTTARRRRTVTKTVFVTKTLTPSIFATSAPATVTGAAAKPKPTPSQGLATRTATTSSAVPTPTAMPSPPPAGKKLIAYLTSWSQYRTPAYGPLDLPVEQLTHVNYAFANIVDGKVAVGDPWGDTDKQNVVNGVTFQGNFGLLNDPRSPVRQRNPNLRVLISIGGWSWSKYFSVVARTPASRAIFVASVVDFVRRYRFDGVDYDWEYPGAEGNDGNIIDSSDPTNFTLLLAETKAALAALAAIQGRAEPYLLTIATGAVPSKFSQLDGTSIARSVDWVNVMTYDFYGSWSPVTGHHGNVPDSLTAINGHINMGIPASKLCLGVPFYARGFANVQFDRTNPAAAGRAYIGLAPGPNEADILEFDAYRAQVANGQLTRVFDSLTGQAAMFNVGTKIWWSGEDEQTARAKGELVAQRGLAGAFWWEQSMDREARLVGAVSAGMATPA
uniref:Predicted protein n=1 Tax=Hordeum vulgare subsp. vulgare TaxID=112509 RepID=F2DY01_HORVV|nr:predicted protein [Hordeum vulgare subsp. vulgare]